MNTREQKGMEMASRLKIVRKDNKWIVPSQTGKGKSGILQSMESGAAFLYDPSHQVVFYYTPKHARLHESSGNLAQHLVRKLLKRGNFLSAFRLARPNLGIHRLLQSHDG